MKLNLATQEDTVECLDKYGRPPIFVSPNRIWYLGTTRVLFGYRVSAWRADSGGPAVDYCAGANSSFRAELFLAILTIFAALPEEITENEIIDMMPTYSSKPINGDPCWEKIREIVDQLPPLVPDNGGIEGICDNCKPAKAKDKGS